MLLVLQERTLVSVHQGVSLLEVLVLVAFYHQTSRPLLVLHRIYARLGMHVCYISMPYMSILRLVKLWLIPTLSEWIRM